MCLGPSAGLTTTGKKQDTAYDTATKQASAEFGSANTAFNDLMSTFQPIAKAGPGQAGWSAPEASAINAATIDTTASAYKNAAAAVRSGEAAVSGGNVALPSGVNIATEEALANAGAAEEATGLRQNVVANYQQGNQNWQFATKGIEAAPGVFSTANQATEQATAAGSASEKTQEDITNAQQSWMQLATGVLGDVTSVATAGLGKGGAWSKSA